MATSAKENNQNYFYKIKRTRYLRLGSLLAFVIVTLPFLFYINDIFPDGAIWENSFFIYHSKYYESVSVFVWVLVGKIIPLTLLVIWFFTSKHWWYLTILIPIAVYTFQLISIIFEDSELLDHTPIYYLLPLVIIILIIVYTIRTEIFDNIHEIDLSELDHFKKSNKKTWWNRFR